eukprot:1188793-Prorocentrum_minimum.AAC.3
MRGRSGVLSIAVRAPNRLELSHTSKVCGRPPTGPQISARSRKTCFREEKHALPLSLAYYPAFAPAQTAPTAPEKPR